MFTLFIFSLLFIFYTFIGYPALLYVRRRAHTVLLPESDVTDKTIDIVLVACNEARNIRQKITNLLAMQYPQNLFRIIVIDDCSDDDTVEIVEGFSSDKITLLRNQRRSGKAYGLNLAMQQATAELVFFVDARQEITTNALRDLSAWFKGDSKVGAVSGELVLRTDDGVSSGIDFYSLYERFIRSTESVLGSVPGVSGAVYMLRRSLFMPIPEDTILDDVLIPMNALSAGYSVKYDPRVIAYDIPSNDMHRERMRKIRTIKGNYQVLFRNLHWTIPFAHPASFVYFSHKVTRLLAPFFALASLCTALYFGYSGLMLGYLYAAGLVAFLCAYPASIQFPKLLQFKILRIASAFVALNWFNLLGFYEYCFGYRAKNWK